MTTAAAAKEAPKVYVKRRGNPLGFWFFEMMMRLSGLKGAYYLLEIVCAHYLLFDREAVSAGLAYTRKRFPKAGALRNYWHVHRLFVNQGRQLIDRYGVARKPDLLNFEERFSEEVLQAFQDPKKGLVLLTSHAGNWQVALRQMGHLKKNLCVVMRPENNPAVRDSLQMDVQGKPVKIIDPQGYLGGVLEMMQALNDGDIVCIMGDRGYGFDTVEVSFLDHPAYFPYGAFSVAAAAECPVVPLLTHKVSEREYKGELSTIWYPKYVKDEKKKEQLRKWVGGYVKFLEAFVEEHPYECFLFHNVWVQGKKEL